MLLAYAQKIALDTLGYEWVYSKNALIQTQNYPFRKIFLYAKNVVI